MILPCFRYNQIFQGFKKFSSHVSIRQIFGTTKERQEKREKILAELKKGYINDLKEVRTTGGKRYLALSEPFPKEESTVLPSIQGMALAGQTVTLPQDCRGSVTLLLLWTRQHGQKACDMYRNTFWKNFKTIRNTNYYEVNLIDNWLFRKMRLFINTNLQKQIPLDRQDRFLCCYDGASEIVDKLFENSLVGHAILLDHSGLVRWTAHGPPTDEELLYLTKCTNNLHNEIPGTKLTN
ncbi:uncharacterized protein LOC114518337 isoform X1 [Dendronephthya gigantea]|uniref:uncharacterized protein LOC114518337 isoform X1 n=1 Tax=Dendronephthya gigantea TaxID=151771 RepID=UPI001069DA47|nr:uncharacterized protein LOC114518337 isoform X1 [Dendronephthya gigantea]